jgi:hypothetical protein
VLLLGLLSGCTPPSRAPAPPGAAESSSAPAPLFRDVAQSAGIRFTLGHGGRSPLDIRETLGHGAALVDFSGDGWLDVVLVGPDQCAYYVNAGGEAGRGWSGRFVERTAVSGLRQDGYWMGCAVGDFDGDGRIDLFVTGHGTCALYRNEGGRFRDVTEAAGVRDTGWSTSAGFGDVDADGDLDLFVARYVRFDPKSDVRFCDQAGVKTACGPTTYDPQRGRLFRNDQRPTTTSSDQREDTRRQAPDARAGEARSQEPGAESQEPLFRDVTAAVGLESARGNALGVAFGDYDGDGRVDLAVANDQLPSDLFRNTGGGRFENEGVTSGIAYNAAGQAYAGMGIDWGDMDRDGRPDLVVTTYQHQPRCLFRQDRPGLFTDVAAAAGIAHATVNTLGFGARWLDFDNDGRLDLAMANGHVVDNIQEAEANVTYRQAAQLFRGRSGPDQRPTTTSSDEGRQSTAGPGARSQAPGAEFEEISHRAGPDFTRPIVGRGLCVGDVNQDGRLDLLLVDAEGPPLLLLNEDASGNHWLSLRLLNRQGRDALGTRVTLTAGGERQMRDCATDGSYMSASEPRVHFGLGSATRAERIEIRWPSGRRQTLRDVAADQRLTIREAMP